MKRAISGTFYFVIELPDGTSTEALDEALEADTGMLDDLILGGVETIRHRPTTDEPHPRGAFRVRNGDLVRWKKEQP